MTGKQMPDKATHRDHFHDPVKMVVSLKVQAERENAWKVAVTRVYQVRVSKVKHKIQRALK